jgi:hypothetical protein
MHLREKFLMIERKWDYAEKQPIRLALLRQKECTPEIRHLAMHRTFANHFVPYTPEVTKIAYILLYEKQS